LRRDRSASSVIQSQVDIKRWQQSPPTAAEARPSCCPSCRAASCLVGERVQLQGHGTRERQVRGPPAPSQPPVLTSVLARRYRCLQCKAVVIVVPREVQGRRVYTLAAIGLALALWGLALATAAQVRRCVSPAQVLGDAAATGWATLRRWARSVARRQLFPSTPDPGPASSLRRVAASAAAALAASADATTRDRPIEHRSFLGAAHAA
jgi:hypothetical protein